MDNHNTHILTDGTSSGYSYKFDKSGKIIFDSIDNLNSEENKKEEQKDESNLEQKSKKIKINSYEKDLEIDIFDLIQIKSKQKIKKEEMKYNEIMNKVNEDEYNDENLNNYSVLKLSNKIKSNKKNNYKNKNNNIIKLNNNINSKSKNEEINNNINSENEGDSKNIQNEKNKNKSKEKNIVTEKKLSNIIQNNNGNEIKQKNKKENFNKNPNSKDEIRIGEKNDINNIKDDEMINNKNKNKNEHKKRIIISMINFIENKNAIVKISKSAKNLSLKNPLKLQKENNENFNNTINNSDINEKFMKSINNNKNQKEHFSELSNSLDNENKKEDDSDKTGTKNNFSNKKKKLKNEGEKKSNKKNKNIINNRNNNNLKNNNNTEKINKSLDEKENTKNEEVNSSSMEELEEKNMKDKYENNKKNLKYKIKNNIDINDDNKKKDINDKNENRKNKFIKYRIIKNKKSDKDNNNKSSELINEKDNNSNFLSPKIKRIFIAKIINKEKQENEAKEDIKEKFHLSCFPSVCNNYYFCTKIKITKTNSLMNSFVSSSRNTNINNSKENNNLLSIIKKNNGKCLKIPIINEKYLEENNKNKNYNSPILIKKNIFNSEESQIAKSNKNIFNVSVIRPKNDSNKKLYNLFQKKKKKNIQKIKDTNYISSLSSERIEKINTTSTNFKNYIKLKKQSDKNIINRNNDHLNYTKKCDHKHTNNINLDTTTRQKNPFEISKLDLLKASLLKKKGLYKRINKKDNNVLVYIKGFKKHFGKEENCPICILRESKAEKRVKLLSATTKNRFNSCTNIKHKNYKNINFSELQDEINGTEFHEFFISELNRNKNSDNEILLKKKVNFSKKKNKDKWNNSMSLYLNSKIAQEKKKSFPVIFNYLES